MTYTDFANKMLIALYQESEAGNDDYFRLRTLVEKYGLKENERWLQRLSEDWRAEGVADVHAHIGSPLEWGVEITGRGMRQVEDEFGGKDGVGTILEPVAAPASRLDDTLLDGGPTETLIESSSWTGLPSGFQLSEERRTRLVNLLNQAEADLDRFGAGNQEKAQARAYIVAARVLADAPEPPVELIWELVQRANSLAGIASLFVSIVALFA